MNENVKTEWVRRLRSGEIPQLKSHLGNQEGERCVLGIPCDIAVEQNVIPAPVLNEDGELAYAGECYGIPMTVLEWAELTSDVEVRVSDLYLGGTFSLAHLNDDYNYTFLQLADLIEDQL